MSLFNNLCQFFSLTVKQNIIPLCSLGDFKEFKTETTLVNLSFQKKVICYRLGVLNCQVSFDFLLLAFLPSHWVYVSCSMQELGKGQDQFFGVYSYKAIIPIQEEQTDSLFSLPVNNPSSWSHHHIGLQTTHMIKGRIS